jgi:hypothetical protein
VIAQPLGPSSERARTLSRRVRAPCSSAARSLTTRTARRAQLTGDLRRGRSPLTFSAEERQAAEICVRAPPQRCPLGLASRPCVCTPVGVAGARPLSWAAGVPATQSRALGQHRAPGGRGGAEVFRRVFGEVLASVRGARRGVRQRVEALQRGYCTGWGDHGTARPLPCPVY